ncbi:FprA family A-type flavoprotein [Clostridium sp. AL.422]|uniref:FprA family A-type flavoprotein n=1 Tax=Clostridium TaxID=1485 RepID=UPI00293DF788|nr:MULTISPECIES: FprA family A-type flavoprotein [unclassified Clostridium]MDV4150210.1 FprA family A-type flavoprotein [Clostridium sp. AL.422]
MKNIDKVTLAQDILWAGKIDDREVPFHRLVLAKGTTYNSYLLKTQKPTVIDTVDIEFGGEFVEYLRTLIDPKEIQYIVINHTEPDHSGGLASLAAQAPEAVIVCTEKAVIELQEMYKLHDRKFLVVKDGDTLDIGGKTLLFKETPYLHTEETMITYCIEDKILFPCDIFSTHVANYKFFDDAADGDITEDFIGYYNVIIHPHRRYVGTLISALKGLDVQMIAPSHGYILRKDVQKYINLYASMSANTDIDKKVTIIYTTIKTNTKKIANILKEAFERNSIQATVFNADKSDKAEILASIQEADAVLVGSSTRYADMIGNLEEVLVAMKAMNLEGKIGAAFGSYGWSGEAIEVIHDYLLETNMNVLSTSKIIKTTGMTHVEFPVRVRFSPKGKEEIVGNAAGFISDMLHSSI